MHIFKGWSMIRIAINLHNHKMSQKAEDATRGGSSGGHGGIDGVSE
jgi:hypothetical protein